MNSVKQCSLSTNVIFKEQHGKKKTSSLLASFKTLLTRKENLPLSSDFIQPVVQELSADFKTFEACRFHLDSSPTFSL